MCIFYYLVTSIENTTLQMKNANVSFMELHFCKENITRSLSLELRPKIQTA